MNTYAYLLNAVGHWYDPAVHRGPWRKRDHYIEMKPCENLSILDLSKLTNEIASLSGDMLDFLLGEDEREETS